MRHPGSMKNVHMRFGIGFVLRSMVEDVAVITSERATVAGKKADKQSTDSEQSGTHNFLLSKLELPSIYDLSG